MSGRFFTGEFQICARRTPHLAERQLGEFCRSFCCIWQRLIIPCSIRNSDPMSPNHGLDTFASHDFRPLSFRQRADIRERISGWQSSRFNVVLQNPNELGAERALSFQRCPRVINIYPGTAARRITRFGRVLVSHKLAEQTYVLAVPRQAG